ncbi:MAG TPA: DUF3575 domain-containing protein [Polyangiaceae bacterium]|nr:DUF3575 domain-containing protein [Polyangiaceae bacterium]
MRHSSSVFASVAFSLFATLAHAGGGSTPDQAIAPPQADQGPTRPAQGDDDHKRFAVALNPLAVTIGRYSLQAEYLPAKHHALTLSPFYTYAPVKAEINGQELDGGSLSGFGGELGYRFYSGNKGPNGFFVGPSLLFGAYSQSAPSGAQPEGSRGSESFTSYGGAIDIGGQAVIGPGIVVGGGFGLQYTTTSRDIDTDNLNLASAIIAGGGVRPRFLFSAGYAF